MPQRVSKRGDAAIALRMAGATLSEIADKLGYDSTQAVQEAMEKNLAKTVTSADRDVLRALAVARYEKLLRSVWKKATSKSDPEQLTAVRQAREIIDRIVAVEGSAAPQQVTIANPTQDALLAWVAKVTAIQMPDVEEPDIFALDANSPRVIEGSVVGSDHESPA